MARNGQRLELTWVNKDKALIPMTTGRYGYTWVDPGDPRFCETRTLVIDDAVTGERQPVQDGVTYSPRADLGATTDNLLIVGESGDALEALTRVPELRDRYVGQVKCVYIDPPFNTGGIFGSSYEDNLEHSIWLTMMRDRLIHLKRLLAADGSIWVHLDDAEVHRMRSLLDETFGAGNFVASINWQKADSTRNDGAISAAHDTILVYGASRTFKLNRLARTPADDVRFTNPDDDPRGPWWDGDPTANHGDGAGGMCYAIQSPLTGEMLRPAKGANWRYGQDRILAAMMEWAPYRRENLRDEEYRAKNDGIQVDKVKTDVCALVLAVPLQDARASVERRLEAGNWPEYIVRRTGGLGRKSYIPAGGKVPHTWWSNDEVGHNREAKSEIKALFPDESPFATPKPERLLERVLTIATDPGDLVVDVFGGSGTTAAVAHKMGRRWITCELLDGNVTRYLRPRLDKIVNGTDPGGITTTESDERIAAVELPDGVDVATAWKIDRGLDAATRADLEVPVDLGKAVAAIARRERKAGGSSLTDDELATLARLAGKLSKDGAAEVDLLPAVKKAITATVRTTRVPTVVNWRGGGGFRVAHLSKPCFDYDADRRLVTLTEAATDVETLTRAVAAHLGFTLTPGGPFHGVRGRMQLYVTRDPLTPEYVETLAAHLRADEAMTIAATMVLDGAAQAARTARRGSRVLHIPTDLFPTRTEARR